MTYKYSTALQVVIDVEKEWMIYRGTHNLYYPSDPRFKGVAYRQKHELARRTIIQKRDVYWRELTDWERRLIDPLFESAERRGVDWIRQDYEVLVLMRKEGKPLQFGWPSPWCRLVGHLRPSEERGPRFTCMECWLMLDRDPLDDSVIAGEPDAAWIAEHTDKAISSTEPTAASGVLRRALQSLPTMEIVQEEAPVEDVRGSGEAGPKGG